VATTATRALVALLAAHCCRSPLSGLASTQFMALTEADVMKRLSDALCKVRALKCHAARGDGLPNELATKWLHKRHWQASFFSSHTWAAV
jgi:hypothetical protein